MSKEVLREENILLEVSVQSKEEAIRKAGQLLVDGGYVNEEYIEKMIEREKLTSTFMGNSIAIPHGTEDAKETIHSSGISILQLTSPVDFGEGNEVKLVFGIAGKNNEHLDILSKIAIACSDEANVEKMVRAKSKEDLISVLGEVN